MAAQQGAAEVYLNLTVGQGSTEQLTGYVRNSYGSVEPEGFNTGGVSGAASRITWDDRRKEMRVSLTVIPAFPLTGVSTSRETEFTCFGSDGRNYTCTDPADSDPDRPWNAGNTLTIRLTFTDRGTRPDPPPGERFPAPRPPSETLPVVYGARGPDYGWALPQIAQDADGVHIQGSDLYLMDTRDEYVYVFDLHTGERLQYLEWDLDPDNTASASWRGLTFANGRWWAFNGDDYYSWLPGGLNRTGPVDTNPSISVQWLHAVDTSTIVYALPHAVGRLDVGAMERGDRNPVVARSQVNYPNSTNDNAGVSVDRQGRLWARQDIGISDGRGNDNLAGVVVYEWEQYRDRNTLTRDRRYDVPTYGSTGNNELVDYWLTVSGGHLYTSFLTTRLLTTSAPPT